jgi:hypothetical protein
MPSIKLTRLPHAQEVPFATIQKLHANPFPGQRSHRLHLKEASYLQRRKPLEGDQLVFHAVRFRTMKGKRRVWVTYLIDGYTRIEAVLENLMDEPQSVLLLTHVVADYAVALDRYRQFNSPKAAKRGKHEVQSGVREATTARGKARDSFESHLLQRGPYTSGIAYSGVPGATTHAKTANGFDALTLLDEMGLRKNVETAPLMAAYIAILARDGKTRSALAKKFIKEMNHFGEYEPDELEGEAVLEARKFHDKRRKTKTTSGDSNVKTVRDVILSMYQYYLDLAIKGPSAVLRHNMTLGEFKAAA